MGRNYAKMSVMGLKIKKFDMPKCHLNLSVDCCRNGNV